jgi:hypothetical protein
LSRTKLLIRYVLRHPVNTHLAEYPPTAVAVDGNLRLHSTISGERKPC